MKRPASVVVGGLAALLFAFGATAAASSEVVPGLIVVVLALPFMLYSRSLWKSGGTATVIQTEEETKNIVSRIASVLTFLLIAGFAYWYLSPTMIKKQIAETTTEDVLTQYEIVRKNGSKTDVCVHSGVVAAVMLQNHDSAGYARWKERQEIDCDAAGINIPKK